MRADFKMNPEVKTLWLEALRSGNYQQGKGVLRTVDDKYCCLGVLCDVAVKNGVIPAPSETGVISTADDDTEVEAWHYGDLMDSLAYLPDAVSDWAMVDRYGSRKQPAIGHVPGLAALNDEGKSFAEIADIIEAEY